MKWNKRISGNHGMDRRLNAENELTNKQMNE